MTVLEDRTELMLTTTIMNYWLVKLNYHIFVWTVEITATNGLPFFVLCSSVYLAS